MQSWELVQEQIPSYGRNQGRLKGGVRASCHTGTGLGQLKFGLGLGNKDVWCQIGAGE